MGLDISKVSPSFSENSSISVYVDKKISIHERVQLLFASFVEAMQNLYQSILDFFFSPDKKPKEIESPDKKPKEIEMARKSLDPKLRIQISEGAVGFKERQLRSMANVLRETAAKIPAPVIQKEMEIQTESSVQVEMATQVEPEAPLSRQKQLEVHLEQLNDWRDRIVLDDPQQEDFKNRLIYKNPMGPLLRGTLLTKEDLLRVVLPACASSKQQDEVFEYITSFRGVLEPSLFQRARGLTGWSLPYEERVQKGREHIFSDSPVPLALDAFKEQVIGLLGTQIRFHEEALKQEGRESMPPFNNEAIHFV